VALATWHLTIPGNGPGILLGGSPGVPPALVLVIGGGAAGSAAAAEAAALGAQVVVLDRDPRRLARLDGSSVGRACVTAVASEFHLVRYLETADVVIGAVAVKGEPAPKVLRRSHIRTMKEGSLFIDMSIDEGGCAETSKPTTTDAPVYVADGIRHICIPNLPSEVAHTASRVMGTSLLPYLVALGQGVPAALANTPALRHAVGLFEGKLVNKSLRRFVQAPYTPLEELVPETDG
jgi:alanine dehydrogenase